MATVEDRIVQMEFQNRGFTSAVQTTLGLLARLKDAINFGVSKKNGIDAVQESANRFTMGNVDKEVSGSTSHWSAWRTAGLIAFATVVHQAVRAGERIISAFTIDPIKAGLENYQTQINAVQTILANTSGSGTTLKTVSAALNQLNTYANQTIFNFSDMAKNIGTFTAAGVDLKTSVSSIKGIANLAALSGSSAEQASTAMYQLSQAIAAGSVKLQDWNSVVNAGLGGKVFQDALVKTARVNGVQIDKIIKKNGSFRNSLQQGWLTSKILTQTLDQFTGELSAKQLKAMGFTDKEAQSILKMGKTAVNAATQIKTIGQLTQALKEEVASAWARVFTAIFGNITQATKLFTKVHTVAENALTGPINHLADLLQKASDLGARDKVIDGFSKAFQALGKVMGAVKDAFHQIFPPATAQSIVKFANVFDNLMKRLTPGQATIDGIRRTFVGVFAAIDIGRRILAGVFGVFVNLFKQLSGGSTAFFAFTAAVADWLVSVDESLKKGTALRTFFAKLTALLSLPIVALKIVASAIANLFRGFHKADANAVEGSLGRVHDRLAPLTNLLDRVSKGLHHFLSQLGQELKPALDGIVALFGTLGKNIADQFKSGNFQGVLDVINTSLLGGIFLLVKKFFSKGLSVDIGGGVLGSIKESFEALTSSMKAMQTQIQARTLLLIASAIGILTASVVALSLINSEALTKALKAMAAGFGELLGSLAILVKISGAAGFVKLPLVAASLNLVATAILILAGAVKILSTMNWQQLLKGLTAVGVLLAEISVATLIISRNSGGMISASVGITAIAIALNILAVAVKLFGSMNWTELAKGLVGVAGGLTAIAVGMKLMPRGIVAQSAGILVIAVALNALYLAVKQFANLDWKTMGKGLAAVAGSLVAIAVGMRLMPKGMAAQAVGLVVIAGALLLIQRAIAAMAKMSFGTIGKGLGVIAASLLILAGAMNLMNGALPGAAALITVAGALAILVPVIQKLGKMKWGDLAKGLGSLAVALGLVIAAGFLATGASVGLFALAAATVALGLGIGAAAAGLGVLAGGLALLATAGSAGIAVLLAAVTGIIARIPDLASAFAVGLINVLTIIGKNGPAIIAAFGTIIASIVTVIIQQAPAIANAAGALLQAFLGFLVKNAPSVVAAGLALLMDLLNGIKNNIGQVTATVAQIIVNFLNSLASHIGQIVAAGLNVLVQFLNGIARNIGRVTNAAGNVVVSFISGISRQIGRIVTAGANAIISFVNGISNNAGRLVTAGANAVINFVRGIANNVSRIVTAAFQIMIQFVNSIHDAVVAYEPVLVQKMLDVGVQMMLGIGKGILSEVGNLAGQLKNAVGSAVGSLGHFLHINSPSKFMADRIGSPISEGIGFGVLQGAKFIDNALKQVVTDPIASVKDTLSGLGDSINSSMIVAPTITPVLDLTNVAKDAAKISGLITPTPIDASRALLAAATISADQQKTALGADNVNPLASVTSLTFSQTNTSPKALSTVDIYRNTKNQLAQAKSALGL